MGAGRFHLVAPARLLGKDGPGARHASEPDAPCAGVEPEWERDARGIEEPELLG